MVIIEGVIETLLNLDVMRNQGRRLGWFVVEFGVWGYVHTGISSALKGVERATGGLRQLFEYFKRANKG